MNPRTPSAARLLLALLWGSLLALGLQTIAAPVVADTAASVVTAQTGQALKAHIEIGAFVDGMQAEPGRLGDFERMTGAKTAIASYYYGYGDIFPGQLERTFADGGSRKVLLLWDMGPTRFEDWYSGRVAISTRSLLPLASTRIGSTSVRGRR